jgi:hypothetical protein
MLKTQESSLEQGILKKASGICLNRFWSNLNEANQIFGRHCIRLLFIACIYFVPQWEGGFPKLFEDYLYQHFNRNTLPDFS